MSACDVPLPETSVYGPSDDYSERTKPYFPAEKVIAYGRACAEAMRDKCALIVRDSAKHGLCCSDSEALAALIAALD